MMLVGPSGSNSERVLIIQMYMLKVMKWPRTFLLGFLNKRASLLVIGLNIGKIAIHLAIIYSY